MTEIRHKCKIKKFKVKVECYLHYRSTTKGIYCRIAKQKEPDPRHAGIVKSVNSDGTFNDVEGNTNRLDSREGEGVYAKKRNLTGISSDLLLSGFIGFRIS